MIKLYKSILVAVMFSTLSINANSKDILTKTALKVVVKTLIKSEKALKPKQIKDLIKILNKTKGTEKIGKILGKMKLPNEVLEDTYMRLAITLKKIKPKEAKYMMQDLKGTKGFRTTIRKILGNSSKKTTGHLHELRLAHSGKKNGFKILAIGEKYSDGIKKMDTDIDLLLKSRNKIFAIEAKSYLPSTYMKPSMIKADMRTLAQYTKQNKNTIPIFSITNKPKSEKIMNILRKEANKNGIQLIFGNPHEQIEQIKILREIL